jgi:hypothetical protein
VPKEIGAWGRRCLLFAILQQALRQTCTGKH